MQPNSFLPNLLNSNQLLSPIDKLVYFLSFLAALFDPKSRLTHISETIIEDTIQKLLPDLMSAIDTNDIQSLFPNNQELSMILEVIKNLKPQILTKNDSLTYLTQAIIKDFPSHKSAPLSEKQIAHKIRLLTAKLILQNKQNLSPKEQLEILHNYFSNNYYHSYIQENIISTWNHYQQQKHSFNLSNQVDFFFDTFFQETTNLSFSIFDQSLNFKQSTDNPFDKITNLFEFT